MKTEGLSFELALQMFEGVEPEDIMYEEELDAIKQFDDYITIYRGTSITEEVPRLSWTLRESVATNNSDFAHGNLRYMFEYADGSMKKLIYAYFDNTAEYTDEGVEHYESLLVFEVEAFEGH